MLLAATFAAAELSSFTTSQTTTCSTSFTIYTTTSTTATFSAAPEFTLSIATSARHASSSWRVHRDVRVRRGWHLRRWRHWQHI